MTPEEEVAFRSWFASSVMPDEEVSFRQWYDQTAKRQGIAPNPDDPEHYYDYRAFKQAVDAGRLQDPSQGGHFPSEFKREGHPRTYLDDTLGRLFDTRTGAYANGQPVPQRLMELSEDSPDTGLKKKDVQLMSTIAALLGKGGGR